MRRKFPAERRAVDIDRHEGDGLEIDRLRHSSRRRSKTAQLVLACGSGESRWVRVAVTPCAWAARRPKLDTVIEIVEGPVRLPVRGRRVARAGECAVGADKAGKRLVLSSRWTCASTGPAIHAGRRRSWTGSAGSTVWPEKKQQRRRSARRGNDDTRIRTRVRVRASGRLSRNAPRERAFLSGGRSCLGNVYLVEAYHPVIVPQSS